ncbi:MAG: cbb3-type cytochrome oxidase assembly protein CcoS [Crocinitomicaceae bacterium]
MGMIYIMLVVSLLVALFFLASFFWAAKDGQFDDDYSPSVRILFDEELELQQTNQKTDGSTEV